MTPQWSKPPAGLICASSPAQDYKVQAGSQTASALIGRSYYDSVGGESRHAGRVREGRGRDRRDAYLRALVRFRRTDPAAAALPIAWRSTIRAKSSGLPSRNDRYQ